MLRHINALSFGLLLRTFSLAPIPILTLIVSTSQVGHPPQTDITAYTSIFSPQKSAPNALKSFAANAKRSSLRSSIAAHLTSHRHISSDITLVKPLKAPKRHTNPALDFWTWSCHALQWAGPDESTEKLKTSHHVLPVFMHHFGCVVPSYESLELIRQVSAGKPIVDMGSGNGYWTFMLRRYLAAVQPAGGKVIAVDSGQSVYRTLWIGDTVVADGIRWLRETRKGGVEDVLLLVYPIVGGDGFTEKVITAYKGDVVCVVGTQCRNGYTAFRDKVIDQWMEEQGCWAKVVQVPVPSFAGKDEALFVFHRSGGAR